MRARPLGHITLALLTLAVGAACESLSPIEPGPDTGPLTAYIDGEAFVAETATSSILPTGIVVRAEQGDRVIRFEVTNRGPSNYLVGQGNPVSAEVRIGSDVWVAEGEVGSGTISITDVFPSFVSGQFDLQLVRPVDENEIEVTLGRFVIIG